MLKIIFRNLRSIFFFLIGLFLVASIIFIVLIIKQHKMQKKTLSFNQNTEKIFINLKKLQESLQIYKETKPGNNFFIYKRNNNSDKVYYYLNILKNEVNNIKSENILTDFETSSKLNEVNDLITDFETNFKLLNENIVKLGNGQYGYTANIIRTENKNDKILKSYPQLYVQFQKLKISKNELLNSGDDEKEEHFFKLKNHFLTTLKLHETLFESTSEKQIVINNINDWINSVTQYFNLRKINGTDYYSGLYNDLEKSVQINESILFEIEEIIFDKISKINSKYLINFTLLISLIILIFILSVSIIFKYIKGEIRTINNELSEFHFNVKEDRSLKEFKKTQYLISEIKKDYEDKIIFAKKLRSNKLSEITTDFTKKDKLGKALLELKNHLIEKNDKALKKAELRAVSDRQKDGIVKFGKIIRQHIGNLEELTNSLLPELVDFIHADIGGIYVINRKDKPEFLKLNASYAYNEKKILNKEIKIGEGLVGTCAADKSTIYIDKIDDDYIKIVSGFGRTKPKSLLLSPIFTKERVYGVIELASLGKFTENDIRFIETLSEDIAYSLAYLTD